MSRATLKNVGAVKVGDREITFDEPVSVWAAMAAAEKAKRQPQADTPVGKE